MLEKLYDPSFGSFGLIPGGLKIFHTLKIAFRCEGKSSRQSFQTIRQFHKSSFLWSKVGAVADPGFKLA